MNSNTQKTILLLIVIIIGAFMFNFFSNSSNSNSNELTDALKNEPFLVDVRTPGEYASGTVQGAVNIPLQEVPNRIAEFKGKDNIIVFCRSGSRSGQAKRILESAGITEVVNGGPWQKVRNAKAGL